MPRRNTIQKNLVLSAVLTLKDHATADEIFQYIRKDSPSVSRGTVYRNLNVLTEEGMIRKIEIPGEADHYDHRLDNHYHTRCLKCGRLFDVDMEVIPDLCERINDTRGFVFLGCDVIFRGICPECTAKEAEN